MASTVLHQVAAKGLLHILQGMGQSPQMSAAPRMTNPGLVSAQPSRVLPPKAPLAAVKGRSSLAGSALSLCGTLAMLHGTVYSSVPSQSFSRAGNGSPSLPYATGTWDSRLSANRNSSSRQNPNHPSHRRKPLLSIFCMLPPTCPQCLHR